MEKNVQPILQFSVFVRELALGKLDTTSTSFTWLRRVMMDSIFSPLSAAFFGLLFGVEALRYRVAN